MVAVKGLGVDVADDHEMGRRWNDESMRERPRGYRHRYRHEYHCVRGIVIDDHCDAVVDVGIDSSAIGGNASIEKMVIGVRL